MRRALATAILAPLLLLGGCRWSNSRLQWGLERMLKQPKYDAFEPSDLFPDGMAMRTPPPGTVPRQRRYLSTSSIATGRARGAYLGHIPIPLDRTLVEHGKDRFDIYCAACHGIDGTGVSMVAAAMPLRHPPSLHERRIVALPPGRIFRIVTDGFGLMPSYARQLSVEERWAVVAYVRALQLSQRVPLGQLPDSVRRQFDRYLRAVRPGAAPAGPGGTR